MSIEQVSSRRPWNADIEEEARKDMQVDGGNSAEYHEAALKLYTSFGELLGERSVYVRLFNEKGVVATLSEIGGGAFEVTRVPKQVVNPFPEIDNEVHFRIDLAGEASFSDGTGTSNKGATTSELEALYEFFNPQSK